MATWIKKADVFVIDIGHSMGEIGVDRTENNLDWSLKWVWNKIARKILSARATDEVGVIAFRTLGTDIPLKEHKRAGYEHISVLSPIQKPSRRMLQYLQEELQVSSVDEGDAISAICIAIQLIEDYCRQKKYDRKIYLITDGKGPADPEDWDLIDQRLQENRIELIICGVDFDDAQYGIKEEDKQSMKKSNEDTYQRICNISKGTLITVNELVDSLQDPDLDVTRSLSTYSGNLTIGDPEDPESLSIAINRYLATRVHVPPIAQSYLFEQNLSTTEGTHIDLKAHKVEQHRIYRISTVNPDEQGEEIDENDVEKGFRYGDTIVPISQEEEYLLQYPCKKGYEIIGFVSEDLKNNVYAEIAMSSLCKALYEQEYYALARLVKKDDQPPTLVVLCPYLTEGIHCLVEAEAPFAEDCRHYKFAPLDRVKMLSQHPHIPTQQQLDAMSDYVDSLDLSQGKGSNIHLYRCENNYNPLVHRIKQAILHRAVYRDDSLPKLSGLIQPLFEMPRDLVERSKETLEALKIASNVKPVPPKSKKRKMADIQGNRPLSGLDVEAALAKGADIKREREEINEIGYDDPAGDFKRMTVHLERFTPVSAQLRDVLRNIVEKSVTKNDYLKVIEAIRVFREVAVKANKEKEFEEFLVGFDRDIRSGRLGGDREELRLLLQQAQRESQTRGRRDMGLHHTRPSEKEMRLLRCGLVKRSQLLMLCRRYGIRSAGIASKKITAQLLSLAENVKPPATTKSSTEEEVMAELAVRAKNKTELFPSFASQSSSFTFSNPNTFAESDRFSKLHSKTFSSMDSITTHYAAKRKFSREDNNKPPISPNKRQKTEEDIPQRSAKRIRVHQPGTATTGAASQSSQLETPIEPKAVYQPIINSQEGKSNQRKLQLSKGKRGKTAKRTPHKIHPATKQPGRLNSAPFVASDKPPWK